MGGTSADIGTIQGGQERYLSEFQIGFGIPISVTCVDVATLGAGGGSIAWIDKGGLLAGRPAQRRRRTRSDLLRQRGHRNRRPPTPI